MLACFVKTGRKKRKILSLFFLKKKKKKKKKKGKNVKSNFTRISVHFFNTPRMNIFY
jgi:hypothetical protein